MKKILIALFIIGALGSIALYFDPLGWRPFRKASLNEVKILLKAYETRLETYEAEHDRLSVAPIDTRIAGAEAKRSQDLLHLSDLIQAARYHTHRLKRELALKETLREYKLGFLAPHLLPLILSALSLCLLLLLVLKEKLSQPLIRYGGGQGLPDKEEYISEADLPRRIETGFSSKLEAQQWLLSDPVLVCEYCGGRMKAISPGTVQQITFYKSVPSGVKDQRVKLGTYWYARPPALLVCRKCGKEVRR